MMAAYSVQYLANNNNNSSYSNMNNLKEDLTLIDSYFHRAEIVKILVASDYEDSMSYLSRNDVPLKNNYGGGNELCTPIYLAIASIPDDFYGHGPTTYFIRALHEANPFMITVRNKTNHDKPLSLLYRRFSRQFDFSEKFFPGDNSRQEVLDHRNKYKAAAVNTWKIIHKAQIPWILVIGVSPIIPLEIIKWNMLPYKWIVHLIY